MSLTPRERLILTLNHKDPGKVVVDLGTSDVTGIHADTLAALRDYLGLEKRPIKLIEPMQQLGLVEEDLQQALGLDILRVSHNDTCLGYPNVDWKPWKLQSGLDVLVGDGFEYDVDEKGRTFVYPFGDRTAPPSAMMPKGGFYFDTLVRGNIEYDDDDEPSGREDFKDDFGVFTDEQLRYIEQRSIDCYNNTDYGLIGCRSLIGLGDFDNISGMCTKYPKGIRTIEGFLMAYYQFPDYIHEIFEYQTEIAMQNLKLFHQAVGDRIQVMQISGADFGAQNGPYFAPDIYREFFKDRHKLVCDWIHENTSWKTFMHTCGSVTAFLQDFHEAGVDVLNPVQCSAKDMDPQMLKDNWGDKFVFWGGGVDTQKTLCFGTPEEVYKEAYSRLEIFNKDGGYVFNPIHNVQAKVSPENLMAFFKALQDYNATRG